MAYLEVVVGPMFAQKTTFLVNTISKYLALNYKCLFINSIKDTRDKNISTHNQFLRFNNNIRTIKTQNLLDCLDEIDNYQVIGIDEIQFYDNLVDFVKILLSKNKIVFCSGLDGDYKQEMFGESIKLCPLADKFTKISSLCNLCYLENGKTSEAPFTKRTVSNQNKVLVGNCDSYQPVCRYHLS